MVHPTNVRVIETTNPNTMHENDINRLSDLLEAFIYHMPFEMGRDEDTTLMKALEIINENL